MLSLPLAESPTTTGTTGAFITRTWDQDVPTAWQELLYTHLPRTGPVVLMLAWEPGDPWRPIERWMLYETSARWWIAEHDPDRLAELEGPNPRMDVDHYCAVGWCQCVFKKNKLVRREGGYSPTKIDFWQWRFYQQHGRSPMRYWTIQGGDGGHRFALTPFEAKIWKQNKGLSDTPSPGDLPYAEFDARVLRDVVAYEPIRRKLVDLMARSRAEALREMMAEEERTRIKQRSQALRIMREMMAPSVDELGYAMRKADPYLRVYQGTREDRIAASVDGEQVLHDAIHDI